jgi:hypothetical protein
MAIACDDSIYKEENEKAKEIEEKKIQVFDNCCPGLYVENAYKFSKMDQEEQLKMCSEWILFRTILDKKREFLENIVTYMAKQDLSKCLY